MAKVALCVIATNDYIDFAIPMLESADKYFLKGHEVNYHLFSNSKGTPKIDGIFERGLLCHSITHEPWPAMTLKRYHIMSEADLSGYDYVFYIDADMRFVAPVGEEIFGELVGVLHPGYYRGGGSWETRKESNAYVSPEDRNEYLAGGFQGGADYYDKCGVLSWRIENDIITAVWHDESHWNCLYSIFPEKFTLLDPSYCMVEELEKRKAWGIDNFEPKIIALSKEHKKYQK